MNQGFHVWHTACKADFHNATRDATLRIGVPSGPVEFFGDVEAEALYRASVERIAAFGATRVGIDFTPFRKAAGLLYAGPWVAERLAAIREFATKNASAMNPTVRDIVLNAADLRAVDAFDAFYELATLTRAAEAEWDKMDAMLLPTSGTIYPIADVLADSVRLNSNLGTYTNFVNLMDLSALAVPAAFVPMAFRSV
jgi:allophanate hydrolase